MFLFQVVQKCQIDIERLRNVHTKVTRLEAKKKDLQAALDARDQKLKEEADRNVGLATELEKATAEIDRLKDETEAQEQRAAQLEATLENQRVKHESTLEKQ